MIPAEELLKILEEKDLVPAEVIAELRAHVARSLKTPKPINAAMAARILVQQGYLTRLLAQRLMSQIEAEWAAKNPRQNIEPLVLRPFGTSPSGQEEEISLAEEPVELLPLEDERPPQLPTKKAPLPSPLPAEPATPSLPSDQHVPDEALLIPRSTSDELLNELFAQPAPVTAGPPGQTTWTAPRRKTRWESPLILFGGGGILLLLFIGVVLLWSLNRRSGDELLAEADADYQAGAYTQAIHKYGQFLESFPQHPQAGPAEVRRGLAKIRQVLQSQETTQALESVQRVLTEISPLPDFHAEADAELTAVLPPLAEKIAQAAFQKADPNLVEKGQQALALCRRFIPQDKRPAAKLNEIETTLQLAQRRINEKEELAKTVRSLEDLLEKGQLDDAYLVAKKFFQEYPQARNDAQLLQVMRRLAEAEKGRVKFLPPSSVPPPPSPPAFTQTAVFTFTKSGQAPVAEDQVVVITDQSTAYACEARTGQLLWQRRLGESPRAFQAPQNWTPVILQDQGTVVLPDRLKDALVCVELRTGKVVREISFPEPPALLDGSLRDDLGLVLGNSGKIYLANYREGKVLQEVVLPQKPAFLPTIAQSPARWYVLGEHSNFFILDPAAEQCLDVWYLGHEPGELAVPPVIVGEFALIPWRDSSKTARLRVFALSSTEPEAAESDAPGKQVQDLPLPGHVRSPLQIQAGRVALITQEGNIQVYQYRVGERAQPLVLLAEGKSPGTRRGTDQVVTPWLVVQGDHIITADTAVTLFELQASAARLVPRWVSCENTLAVTSPIVLPPAIFYAYRRPGQSGLFIAALGIQDGKVYWEVHLGDPGAATLPSDDSQSEVMTVTLSGHLAKWDVSSETQERTVVEAHGNTEPPADLIKMSDPSICPGPPGVCMITYPGATNVVIVNGRSRPPNRRSLHFAVPVAGPSCFFAGGWVVALANGTLVWFSAEGEAERHVAYQGTLIPGKETYFTGVVSYQDEALIVADNHGQIVKLRLSGELPESFVIEREQRHSVSIVSPLALLSTLIVAVDEKHQLVLFDAATLQQHSTRPLPAHCLWGPVAVSNLVCFFTADGTFWWLTDQDTIHSVLLGEKIPKGWPIYRNGQLIVLTSAGDLVTIDLARKEIVSVARLSVPVATGPNLLGDTIWIATLDGCWLRVPLTVVPEGAQVENTAITASR